MMRMITRDFSQQEWGKIVSAFGDLSLMQTWEYAEAKAANSPWKVERAVFSDGGRVVGATQAMTRYVPGIGKGLVWISRGPLWRAADDVDVSTAVTMLKELRQYWVVDRGMYLRVLPTLLEGELDSDLLTANGYQVTDGSSLWASARLDLSLPLEVLRSRLQQKWRNCLNKAERQGIVTQSGGDGQVFANLLSLYEQMLAEKNFVSVVTPALLTQLQSRLPDDGKLWGISGRLANQELGGVIIARYGQSCEYLVGAVNDSGKPVNAGQLLLWQAITQMKEMGYRWFDLGGMDPVRTSKGILHFKKGVNGSPYSLMGEIEAFNRSLLNHAIRWRVRRQRNQLN